MNARERERKRCSHGESSEIKCRSVTCRRVRCVSSAKRIKLKSPFRRAISAENWPLEEEDSPPDRGIIGTSVLTAKSTETVPRLRPLRRVRSTEYRLNATFKRAEIRNVSVTNVPPDTCFIDTIARDYTRRATCTRTTLRERNSCSLLSIAHTFPCNWRTLMRVIPERLNAPLSPRRAGNLIHEWRPKTRINGVGCNKACAFGNSEANRLNRKSNHGDCRVIKANGAITGVVQESLREEQSGERESPR